MKTKEEEDKWREKDFHWSIYEALLFRETERKLLLHTTSSEGGRSYSEAVPGSIFFSTPRGLGEL